MLRTTTHAHHSEAKERFGGPRAAAAVATIASALALALAPGADAAGRIVIAHDEWTLSNSGWVAPNDPGIFANNVVSWTAGVGPKNILIHTNNFGLTQSQLTSALSGAGHTVTISVAALTLETAQTYDLIMIGGYPVDNPLLVDYVDGGGNVYLCAGTSSLFNPNAQFGAFLASYGLGVADQVNNLSGSFPIGSSHPIFAGVDALYHLNGNDVFDLDPGSPANQVLVFDGTNGLYAVYDGGGTPCLADLDGDGTVGGGDITVVLGDWGTADATADLDGSGTVDGGDITAILGAWGPCP